MTHLLTWHDIEQLSTREFTQLGPVKQVEVFERLKEILTLLRRYEVDNVADLDTRLKRSDRRRSVMNHPQVAELLAIKREKEEHHDD
ncbi:MAG: hypothetical protein IIZ83_06685 [Oscillospiraceae bacterium]|nr:hypothetical protein [Oscillospiraceae bacterium]